MTDRAATQPGEKSFDAAVRNYERRTGGKIQALTAHKKGIAELRAKQASFRTIANLLKLSGINVSHDTVARFCHEVLGQVPRRKSPVRPVQGKAQTDVISILRAQREASPPAPFTPPVRTKGPRIADPKNV